jgi:hypothetical protein
MRKSLTDLKPSPNRIHNQVFYKIRLRKDELFNLDQFLYFYFMGFLQKFFRNIKVQHYSRTLATFEIRDNYANDGMMSGMLELFV